ncbi:methyltransferase domain-containing protein [Anabaena cylindrica UHCC 0172]|uniref:methyltransferase domain-containing protein n=1 Tax=Anabaena cylindrica TaxID=1165 RepID=UPI002B1F846E|nr:methyltransferase domain-containing protein [Anabaena cylindrica]MEA5550021.1 methyltransferase domain-containing protein [Anabaena cylindrica UHCC 0172]
MKIHYKSLENPKSSESERHSLHNKNFFAPPLDDEFYAQSYELRKAASTMTVAAIEWFRSHVTGLVEGSYSRSPKNDTLSVLSIGSGEGDIDVEIIHSLLPSLNPRWKRLKYVALEPNPIHRERFLQRLEKASLDENVEVSIREDCFEPGRFESEEKYDLVLLTHVLYYFDDPYQAIQTALNQTKESGQVVIVHQTATGIPQIQRDYMLEVKGNQNEMFTAENIRNLLDSQSHLHQFHHVEARLDVTECLHRSETGVKIMSFCMECDLRQLQEAKFTKILQAFSRLAESEDSGKAFIREPIGVFVVSSPSLTIPERSPEDKDPVIDYWQLASNFNWSDTLLSQYHQGKSSSLRLLDVACGTGRWLQAFHHYIQLDERIENVVYDLLDPCGSSISQASQKMPPSFVQGTHYVNTIQGAKLESNSYGLLWSMHGFYMIPRRDLASVLKKCASLLKDTGIGFIALATRKSFYVDFYEQYLQIFREGKGAKFTSAEDVIESLSECGIEHQVHRIFYEESIKADDYAALEHYIKNEATVNSFNKDKETEQLSESHHITLEELLSHPEMERYLNSLIRNSVYYFPEEIWLISFNSSHF